MPRWPLLQNSPLDALGQCLLVVVICLVAIVAFLDRSIKKQIYKDTYGSEIGKSVLWEKRSYFVPKNPTKRIWRTHVSLMLTASLLLFLAALMIYRAARSPRDMGFVLFLLIGAVVSLVGLARDFRRVRRERRESKSAEMSAKS